MYRYSLIDSDNNEYIIRDKTFRVQSTEFTVEVDSIEKSFQAGADFPGIARDQSKELNFVNDINYSNERIFRNTLNEMIKVFSQALIIRDNINKIETGIKRISNTINYDGAGAGFNLGTNANAFNFTQFIPYWRDIDYTIIEESASGQGIYTLNNTGFVETPAIITLDALESITKFIIYIEETSEGIVVQDEQFGTGGLNTYIIDNATGIIELNQIIRNHKIKDGTGPFLLPIGISNIVIDASGQILIEIKYKRRYYL